MEREQRLRTLSIKGQSLYEETVSVYYNKLFKFRRNLEIIFTRSVFLENDLKELKQNFDIYDSVSNEFTEYLTRVGSEESSRELSAQQLIWTSLRDKVFEVLESQSLPKDSKHVDAHKESEDVGLKLRPVDINVIPNFESVSQMSKRSRTSRASRGSSTVTAMLMEQKARAESLKVKLKFAQQEAQIKRQQADLEANLSVMKLVNEVDAEEAALKAMHETLDEAESISSPRQHESVIDQNQVLEPSRTETFVNEQNMYLRKNKSYIDTAPRDVTCNVPVNESDTDYQTVQKQTTSQTLDAQHFVRPSVDPAYVKDEDACDLSREPSCVGHMPRHTLTREHEATNFVLNPGAKPYIPDHFPRNTTPIEPQITYGDMCSEFNKFMLRKDLLYSRLTNFSDRPEAYAMWKATFCGVVRELSVSPADEIDLLVKWLGPVSSRHAVSIRKSYASNPTRAVQMIWERLEERYGSPEMMETALIQKLTTFDRITNRDSKRLYDLLDILMEIEAAMSDDRYKDMLSYFNASSGINPIVHKLPYGIQDKWTSKAFQYKQHYHVIYPPLSFFIEFIRDVAKIKNDPGFVYEAKGMTEPTEYRDNSRFIRQTYTKNRVRSLKTDFVKPGDTLTSRPPVVCPYHNTEHLLNACRAFRTKPFQERREFLQQNGICSRCCGPVKHARYDCTSYVKCYLCGSTLHPTAMHVYKERTETPRNYGGETRDVHFTKSSVGCQTDSWSNTNIKTKCTEVCDQPSSTSKSCGKILLVNVFPENQPNKCLRVYAMIDDQSNQTLATPKFFDFFKESGRDIEYILTSCAGSMTTSGRRAQGYVVESVDGVTRLNLPPIIECENIPNVRSEIPTPQVARNHPHLHQIADQIPPMDNEVEILLLVGRDLAAAHHVLDQLIGDVSSPFAQRLPLGWVIVGEVCLGGVHRTDMVNVNKTHFLKSGRPTSMIPCPNDFSISKVEDAHTQDIFTRTSSDNLPGMSREDLDFVKLMGETIGKTDAGNWVAPLPFRPNRPRLPCNRRQAEKRAKMLETSMRANPVKREHMFAFMDKIIKNEHAELAPSLPEGEEVWYLPLFGVYSAKKPDQIRGVFDSSAKQDGLSLNDILMSGPDLINNLLGILLRFRLYEVALTADIEQMFYSFKVNDCHRNFLRFLWYKDNKFCNPLVEYRMTAHVFGNSPSPAVAAYGLKKSVENAEADVKDFVTRNFYVDDALISTENVDSAVSLMKRTQKCLKDRGNLRLHKIASNKQEVISQFDTCDLAKDIEHLDIEIESPPLQRSLGLYWNITHDSFTFRSESEARLCTRRGVLATINSLFDPIGFAAPVILRGKLLLRDLFDTSADWDDPLPADRQSEWEQWRDSLHHLDNITISRCYTDSKLHEGTKKEIHVFADASKDAIAAVAYMKIYDVNSAAKLGFVLGKSKVAPHHGHTIPRLELCAALLATELGQTISKELDIPPTAMRFYTDSKVVLGYLHNRTRRFYVYVSNRVDKILNFTQCSQWSHVPTDINPADEGTRGVEAKCLQKSIWLSGTSTLRDLDNLEESHSGHFPLVQPDDDKEVRLALAALVTSTKTVASLAHRFDRFSTWSGLVRSFAFLKHVAKSFHTHDTECNGWHKCSVWKTSEFLEETDKVIIREVQKELYSEEINCLTDGKDIPSSSPLRPLSPILDNNNLLCVGGRLNRAQKLCTKETNPVILPKAHHVTLLIIQHYHSKVKHQGRHFTEGAVRSAGYWVIGGKRIIASVLHNCVTCKRLRGKFEWQKMSDLPADRVEPCPPFTYVGVDTFGPWEIITRRTRGGQINSKRWAILFTCLVVRAIHLEIIEELSTSSFINALRRFISLRGHVKQFRSDRGTNFIGAVQELKIDKVLVEQKQVETFLSESGTTWIFNTPHSSHMGGAWERLIGVSRRILNCMLMDLPTKHLTHEVLSTFLAEVTAIVNARPLTAVSSDPEAPAILTPAMLLMQKSGYLQTSSPSVDTHHMHHKQWKHVQQLADIFWNRWRKEYLHSLQIRPKWQIDRRNLQEGDVILLKNTQTSRNDWPTGLVEKVFPSQDGRVRKVDIAVISNGKRINYVRPVTDCVLLLAAP